MEKNENELGRNEVRAFIVARDHMTLIPWIYADASFRHGT